MKSTTGSVSDITDREIEVVELEMYLEQCYSAFENTILEEATRSGLDVADLSGTDIQSIINELISSALTTDFFRVLSFGDSGSVSDYYDAMDGIWTKLIAAEAAGSEVKKIADITALNQTDGSRALDYMRSMYSGADIVLKQLPASEKKFFVTGNVYENLMETYEDAGMENGGLVQRVENGVESLRFRGIDVVPVYAWDAHIAADSLGNPVRILYTTPDNHVIGVENANDRNAFRVKYDDDIDTMKYRGKFKLGYNFVHGGFSMYAIGVEA